MAGPGDESGAESTGGQAPDRRPEVAEAGGVPADRGLAIVTGAARGIGRAIAIRLARDGHDIAALDRCTDGGSTKYPGATTAELAETVDSVRQLGRSALSSAVDVRDTDAMRNAINRAVAELGPPAAVVANAGILGYGRTWEVARSHWDEIIEVNLTGAWNTVAPAVPDMIAAGRGGAIVLISSSTGLGASPLLGAYSAAKHGLVGLMRALAAELGPHAIRVNTVHPGGVATAMAGTGELAGLLEQYPEYRPWFRTALPHEYLRPEEIADLVGYLVSDQGRHMTGSAVPMDGGAAL